MTHDDGDIVPQRQQFLDHVSHLKRDEAPGQEDHIDNLRRSRMNLYFRGLDEPHAYKDSEDLRLKLEDPVLSKPTLADFKITRPIPEDRCTYHVVKTNDGEEYGGRTDIGQMLVYPGEICVRKAVPVSIFGQSIFYDRDEYFLESKIPQLSEATCEKFQHKECIYVKKLGVVDPQAERSEGFVPRRCLEAHDSTNCKFIFDTVPDCLDERLYGGPRICLP